MLLFCVDVLHKRMGTYNKSECYSLVHYILTGRRCIPSNPKCLVWRVYEHVCVIKVFEQQNIDIHVQHTQQLTTCVVEFVCNVFLFHALLGNGSFLFSFLFFYLF